MGEIEEMNKVLSEWAQEVIDRIKYNLDFTGTTASGKTKDSLRYEVETDEYGGKLTIFGRQYFQGVEEGRPAGRIPYKFQDILYTWAEAKGILSKFGDTESKQRSALYMVGQFIKEHGTQLYRDGGRLDIYTNTFDMELPKLRDKVAYHIKQTIHDYIAE